MINIVYLNCFNLSHLFIFTKEWLRLKHLKIHGWNAINNHSGYLLWNFLWLVNVVFFDAVICWVSFLLVVFGFLFLVVVEFFVLLELLGIYSCYLGSNPLCIWQCVCHSQFLWSFGRNEALAQMELPSPKLQGEIVDFKTHWVFV